MSGRHRTAFACVRPPGHHSGVKGLLHDAPSCGFCLLNSVAVAAPHALSTHGDRIKKVAIVDFDVHHGNGIQNIFEDDPRVLYVLDSLCVRYFESSNSCIIQVHLSASLRTRFLSGYGASERSRKGYVVFEHECVRNINQELSQHTHSYIRVIHSSYDTRTLRLNM